MAWVFASPKTFAFIGAVDSWDANFFHIAPRLAKNMDPQQVAVLQTVWQALEDAGISPQTLYRTR